MTIRASELCWEAPCRAVRHLGARHATAILATLVCVLAAAQTARATIVAEPSILGASQNIHESEGAGWEGNTVYWVSTQGLEKPEVNAALWETALAQGDYRVEAWIPKKLGYTYARYDLAHSGQTSEVRLRQSNFGDEWVTLGNYAFDGSTARVRSTDAAGYPGEQLAWDAVRWTPVMEIPPNVEEQGNSTTINEPQISGPDGFAVRFVGVGYHGDLIRADARGAGETAVNTATWHVGLPVGEYAVEAFIPAEHAEAETTYTVDEAHGEKQVGIAQKGYNNLWVKLGVFSFGGNGATVTSTDATGMKGQEIAWDAMRFTASPITPPRSKEEVPTGGGETSKEIAPPPQVPLVEPLVPEQDQPVEFERRGLHLRRGGPRVDDRDSYSIKALYPVPKTLSLRYRCLPCVIVGSPLKLKRHTHIPITRLSYGHGDLRQLVNKKIFFKGTVLQVEAYEPGYRRRLYSYRLPGRGEVEGAVECNESTPTTVRGCAS